MESSATAFDRSAFNSAVQEWDRKTLEHIKASVGALGLKGKGELLATLKVKEFKHFGVIDQVGFVMPRFGVWIEKGARRGHGGVKGSKWYNSAGKLVKTDPKSFGKMNTGDSPARPWFNPVLTRDVETLADIMIDFYGSAAINSISKTIGIK